MSKLILTLKHLIQPPVHLDFLSPDNLAGRKISEIANDEIWEGNRQVKLKSLFNVEGDPLTNPEEATLEIVGDLSRTRRIGYKMKTGTIHIKGSGGLYIGESMKAGRIIVEGNVDSWLGSNMKGGSIEVLGNARDFIGSASRGTTKGMVGGSITVRGNAGSELGAWMQSGIIRISGHSEMFPGARMQGGTIHIAGDCSGRAGANMKGGKIVISGKLATILPSFSFDEIRDQTKVEKDNVPGPFYVFTGDNNDDGNGRVFVNVGHNPQLKWCERFLER